MRALAEPCDVVIDPAVPITKARSSSLQDRSHHTLPVPGHLGTYPQGRDGLCCKLAAIVWGWSNVSGISAQTAAILEPRRYQQLEKIDWEKWSGLGPESRNEGRARDFSGSGAEIA